MEILLLQFELNGQYSTSSIEVVVVARGSFDLLQRDDDTVIKLLSVLRFAERQVDVVALVTAVCVLDLQTCVNVVRYT